MEEEPPRSTVTLIDLWRAILADRWLLLTVLVAIVGLALVWGALQTRQYVATAVLVAAHKDEGGSAISGSGGLLGAASSLAGIDLPSGNDTDKGIAVFTSRTLAREIITRHRLAPLLFPGDWDWTAGRWKEPSTLTGLIQRTRYSLFGGEPPPTTRQPTDEAMIDEFLRRIGMVENKRTGIITLTVVWTDPAQATRVAELVLATGNEYMRRARLDEATQRIEFLKREASTTSIESVSTAITRLIEIEMASRMRANTKPDFMFEVIDPPFAPARPSSPQMMLIFLMSLVLGAGISIVVVMIRFMWRRR